MKDNDRKINQYRFLTKLCNTIKVFDHDLRRFNYPEGMKFYRDQPVRHCEVEYLRLKLKMQCQSNVVPIGEVNRLLLEDHLYFREPFQVYEEEVRLLLGNVLLLLRLRKKQGDILKLLTDYSPCYQIKIGQLYERVDLEKKRIDLKVLKPIEKNQRLGRKM